MGSDDLPYTDTAEGAWSWDVYAQYRPSYPPSLWSSWLAYHTGPLHAIHEVGCGGALGTLGLLQTMAQPQRQQLQHLVLSDPGPDNVTTAASVLAPMKAQLPTDVQMSYNVARAEDPITTSSSLDFVMACECMHWTDPRVALPVMAAPLRPGGTLALVYYNGYPSIRQAKAARALENVFTARYRELCMAESGGKVGQVADRGFLQSCTGLDFVPLDGAAWTDVRRVFYNMPVGTTWPLEGEVKEIADQVNLPASCIDKEKEQLMWVEKDEGWEKNGVGVDFFKGNLMMLPEFFNDKVFEGKEWKIFEGILEEFGGSLDVYYAVSVVLARKK